MLLYLDPMHSISIDNLELRWRWMYGGEQLGFKRLIFVSKGMLVAKLFCVPGEAVEMDGKRLTLNKGLGTMQGKGAPPVTNSMLVVRHGMTLGEMAELPVVMALFEVLTSLERHDWPMSAQTLRSRQGGGCAC